MARMFDECPPPGRLAPNGTHVGPKWDPNGYPWGMTNRCLPKQRWGTTFGHGVCQARPNINLLKKPMIFKGKQTLGPFGSHLGPIWFPFGSHLGPIWVPFGSLESWLVEVSFWGLFGMMPRPWIILVPTPQIIHFPMPNDVPWVACRPDAKLILLLFVALQSLRLFPNC